MLRLNYRWRGAAAVLFGSILSAGAVMAGPVDDMKSGEAAFRQGDVVAAASWFRKAAEQGYAPAQVRLADILDYSESNEEAVDWYRKAAEQGSADGAYGLARMYANGEGIEQSNDKALEWYTRAAEQGHQGAMWALASAYETGALGVKADHAKTLQLLRTAAERPGGGWALNRLARAYRKGELGLPVDPDQAAQLEKRLHAETTPAPPEPDAY